MPAYRVEAGTEIRDYSGELVATVVRSFDMFNDRIDSRNFVYADGSPPVPATLMPPAIVNFLKRSLSDRHR